MKTVKAVFLHISFNKKIFKKPPTTQARPNVVEDEEIVKILRFNDLI
ncbi:MAG: hypothetical protein ACXWRZ_15690 [Bdellovibrio sp.]